MSNESPIYKTGDKVEVNMGTELNPCVVVGIIVVVGAKENNEEFVMNENGIGRNGDAFYKKQIICKRN